MLEKLKKYLSWDNLYIFEEICGLYAIVTVINSSMMVLNIDTPKNGEFAYVHLLSRLLIISVVILIFDFRYIMQEIVQLVKTIKEISGLSPRAMKEKIYEAIIRTPFCTINTIFTVAIIVLCIVNISLISAPKGGTSLYFNLLLLYVLIAAFILAILLLSKVHKKN